MDNRKKRGKSDRIRAAGKEKWELYYVARKFGVTPDRVREVIKAVGNMRVDVYARLRQGAARRKKRT